MYKQKNGQSDGLGMSDNTPIGGVPFRGRVSAINSQQIIAWGTLGFKADADLYTIRGDLENGDVVVDDAGVNYLVQGRSRRVPKGNIPTYWKYALLSGSFR